MEIGALLGRLGISPYQTSELFRLDEDIVLDEYCVPYVSQVIRGIAYEGNGIRLVLGISRIPKYAKKE